MKFAITTLCTGAITENDVADLHAMHSAMNMPYPMPDLKKMILSIARNEGGPVAAAGLMPMYEAYLWINPGCERMERWCAIQSLNAGLPPGYDVSAWPPPEVEKYFGKRLAMLGWKRSRWPSWSRRCE